MDFELYRCIQTGDIGKLKEIVSEDLLLRETTCRGNTAIHVAVQYRRKDFVEVIYNKCPSLLLHQNMKGETALHTAVTAASVAIVEFLINCDGAPNVVDKQQKDYETGGVDKYPKHLLLGMVNKEMDTALHIAARNGLSEIVKILIHEDVDKKLVRMANKEMDTALHEAAQNNHANVVKPLTAADPMHEYGANKSGKTPLYLAVEKGYCDVTRLILATCLRSAHGGPSGRTALHAAVIRNDSDITKMLLDKKPGLIKDVDERGWIPLHYAVANDSIYIISRLLHLNRSIGYLAAKDGTTALHIASRKGNLATMVNISQYCPDVWELPDDSGKNILHIAVEFEQHHVIKRIFRTPHMVESLVNEQDNDGNTPFHLAAYKSLNVEDFINDNRVNKMVRNKENSTALEILEKKKVSIFSSLPSITANHDYSYSFMDFSDSNG